MKNKEINKLIEKLNRISWNCEIFDCDACPIKKECNEMWRIKGEIILKLNTMRDEQQIEKQQIEKIEDENKIE